MTTSGRGCVQREMKPKLPTRGERKCLQENCELIHDQKCIIYSKRVERNRGEVHPQQLNSVNVKMEKNGRLILKIIEPKKVVDGKSQF